MFNLNEFVNYKLGECEKEEIKLFISGTLLVLLAIKFNYILLLLTTLITVWMNIDFISGPECSREIYCIGFTLVLFISL